jgi:hypothetical protein
LEQLQAEGYPINPEDVARLSPLGFDHINLLGRYAFSVPDSVVRGELRPLRNPSDAMVELPDPCQALYVALITFLTRVSIDPQHPISP